MMAYLIYLILKGFSIFINLLPEGFSLWMGRQLGSLAYYLDREHRKVAFQNLLIAFGQEKSEEELHAIAKKTFQNLGMIAIEFFRIPRMDIENFRKKLVVEGAGAVPLAALLENKERFQGKRVVLVVSGGNIDFTLIDRILLKGLMTSGRLGVFAVVIDDIAGSLHAVTGIVGSHKANILSVAHDRTTGDVAIGKAKVVFTVEVRSREHLASVLAALRDSGYGVRGESPSQD